MYNTPVRFDGDIIITDPCYICKKSNIDYSTCPSWWDFVTRQREEIKNGTTYHYPPKAEDYPDCREKTFEDYGTDDISQRIAKIELRNHKPMFSPTLDAEWKAYYEADEKWHEENKRDWEICEYGKNMEALGIHNYVVDSTLYGDWSCTTYNSDTKEVIGEFCADAGMVAVFLLDEVLKYNPDFDYHTERPWTTTLIKDFHGTVELAMKKSKRYGDYVEVIGKGNINFVGKQTGI